MRYSVMERTNIAPAPSPSMMMKILSLSANAPITPSKLKLASRVSKYKKPARPFFTPSVPKRRSKQEMSR